MRQERRFVAHDGMCTHRQDPIDPNSEIVPMTSSAFWQALERYRRRADKTWGLTDCASLLIMEEKGITDALSADRDFQQAGFKALLLDARYRAT